MGADASATGVTSDDDCWSGVLKSRHPRGLRSHPTAHLCAHPHPQHDQNPTSQHRTPVRTPLDLAQPRDEEHRPNSRIGTLLQYRQVGINEPIQGPILAVKNVLHFRVIGRIYSKLPDCIHR